MIRLMISLVLSAAFVSGATGLVKETLPKGDDKPVRDLLQKYKKKGPIKIKLRKLLKSELLATEKVSEGLLKIKKDKLRLEISKPDKSLMVVDGKHIWIEQSALSFEGEASVNVTKFPLTEDAKASAILSILFAEGSELKAFQLLKVSGEKESRTYAYQPKSSDSEYSDLKIVIQEEEGRILSLSYTDDSENLVTYDFGVTKFKAKVPDKDFNYVPPKGAEVVDPTQKNGSIRYRKKSSKQSQADGSFVEQGKVS
ncbi:MAG: outer membrane lipoprotein carrier protein LolA [Bdellovibrionales bacterium]|nr:outer membrane lipoprotein carrier protein LolA [Bdellovibrionales bacterium]